MITITQYNQFFTLKMWRLTLCFQCPCQYFYTSDENPFVMLAWRCQLLSSFTLFGRITCLCVKFAYGCSVYIPILFLMKTYIFSQSGNRFIVILQGVQFRVSTFKNYNNKKLCFWSQLYKRLVYSFKSQWEVIHIASRNVSIAICLIVVQAWLLWR